MLLLTGWPPAASFFAAVYAVVADGDAEGGVGDDGAGNDIGGDAEQIEEGEEAHCRPLSEVQRMILDAVAVVVVVAAVDTAGVVAAAADDDAGEDWDCRWRCRR